MTLVAIYVDDLIIAATTESRLDELESSLRSRYSMKPTGELTFVLGIKVTYDRVSRTVFLSNRLTRIPS